MTTVVRSFLWRPLWAIGITELQGPYLNARFGVHRATQTGRFSRAKMGGRSIAITAVAGSQLFGYGHTGRFYTVICLLCRKPMPVQRSYDALSGYITFGDAVAMFLAIDAKVSYPREACMHMLNPGQRG